MKQHVTRRITIGLGLSEAVCRGRRPDGDCWRRVFSGDAEALLITSIVGPAVVTLPGLTCAFQALSAVGLLKGKSWARILVLILGIFNLIDFPVGTLIGVYTIWVLLNQETALLFDGEAKAANFATS